MKNHKVVDIKITYEPENMDNMEELEKKVEAFLNEIKGTKGTKVSAKRHNVAVDVMLDEYGLEIG
jgi:GH25 family lysozyme M1 (1,4-beta-N-acetylmuramidase)